MKVVARIIFDLEEPVIVNTTKGFLAKQNSKVTSRMSLFSARESVLIRTTLVKSLQRHCSALRWCSYQNKYGQQSLADIMMLR